MRYRFDDYVLDTDRRELRRRDVALAIEPLVFDILAHLVRNRERVVGKDDLRAVVWEGRVVSESTLSSCMTSVRGAVGDNGEDQRLIRTLPRRGFRFVGVVHEDSEPAAAIEAEKRSAPEPLPPAGSEQHDELDPGTISAPASAPVASPHRPAAMPRRAIILTGGLGLGAVAAILLLLWFKLLPITGAPASRPVQTFDAAAVPLVSEEVRAALAAYEGRPDVKALAIAPDGVGIADSEPDAETAKREALRQCGLGAKRVCRIYAVGKEVVWSKDTVPAPAPRDLRSGPLELRLVPEAIPTISDGLRLAIAKDFVNAPDHKALAISPGYAWFYTRRATRDEAIRLAVEHCSIILLRPCLLLSVDGFLTVQIPTSHRATGVFLPSTDPEISPPDRERIAEAYQGREWRALARGKNGSWHAVSAAASEDAAAEAALKSCAQADGECRLYAIGNFRVP